MSRALNGLERLEPRVLLFADTGLDHEVFPNYLPQTHTQWIAAGYLTSKSTANPLTIAMNYMRLHTRELGLEASDVANPIVVQQYTDAHNGLTHVYLRQQANGLEVINANARIHVARDGRVFLAHSSFVGGLTAQLEQQAVAPKLTPTQAIAAGAAEIGITLTKQTVAGRVAGKDRHSTLRNSDLSLDDIPSKLHYVPRPDGGADLAWNMVVRTPDGEHWYNMSVADSTRKMTFQAEWMSHLNSYNVYAMPLEAPNEGGRTIVTDPADPVASPFGWHDTNGVAGAEFTTTIGNNTSAQEDRDANNTGGLHPDGGATLDFDFGVDFTVEPTTQPTQSAAIVNLFYWNNVLHDVHYKYGFTEAAANFQTNNYGNGGVGNDAVQADAQDGSGTNNANFGTPADGGAGRMQMYLFTAPTPDRDGDFDAMVIAHEFGHGISNRLTDAGANGLTTIQSRGLGEGWGDIYSLMFTQDVTDTQNAAYPSGTYVLNQPLNGPGIRRRPYSFDKTIDPLDFDAYGTSGTTAYGVARSTEVHNSGELWTSALWDMNWLLINKYGYDQNLYTGWTAAPGPGHAGNKLAMQLIADGMKLQPNNPSFTQARDAILAADQALTGGVNQLEIWTAFARRGLGVNASTPGSTSTAQITLSFEIPVADPYVNSHSPTGTIVTPASFIDFRFNQPMDQTSFSVLDDVVSFTGPGGSNLLGTITGFSWQPNNTLRVNFPATSAVGTYSMTIGPNILAADNGNPMDADGDGTPGEIPDDRYTGSFTYATTLGPEGFGYKAAEFPVENIDLVIGQSGVVTLLNAVNDTAGTIALPAGNTFNFYGTNNTSVFVNPNGLITFGSSTTSSANGDLTTVPTQAGIAVLWDNWTTAATAAGATDSAVLYRIDGNRLIIEWSDVPLSAAANGAVTFQAILQLNTGATPGRIIANYVDVTTADAGNSGAGASEGIKNAGTQGTNRLLVAQNSGSFPWVQTGKAILYALDVTAPTVTASSFAFLTSHSVSISFDDNVSASLGTSDLLLHNNTTNTDINAADMSVSYDGGSNTATFTFPGLLDQLLPDGDYTATLVSSGVTDASGNPIDGDGNGTIGGNHTFGFFFINGDANRDRTVNLLDFNIMAANFGGPGDFSDGDFTYDGIVNLADFNVLASRFGQSVAPASSAGDFSVPLHSGGSLSALATPSLSTRATDLFGPGTSNVFGQVPIAPPPSDLEEVGGLL